MELQLEYHQFYHCPELFFCSQICNTYSDRLDNDPPKILMPYSSVLYLFKLHGKRDSADGIKVIDLKIVRSSRWAQCNQMDL